MSRDAHIDPTRTDWHGVGMPTKQSKYQAIMTVSQFEATVQSLSESSPVLDRARRVLVDGESVSAVAASSGVGKERVYATVKKIARASGISNSRYVPVWH